MMYKLQWLHIEKWPDGNRFHLWRQLNPGSRNPYFTWQARSRGLEERNQDSRGNSVSVRLLMLSSVITTIPVSTATGERTFSGIDLCMSPQHVKLRIDRVTTLLFGITGSLFLNTSLTNIRKICFSVTADVPKRPAKEARLRKWWINFLQNDMLGIPVFTLTVR
jgi:hypothetical protein